MTSKIPKRIFSCQPCRAKCCKSVTVEINTPRSVRGFDEVRWFLLHKDVHVYIGTENDWHVEFRSACTMLGPDHRCKQYATRPTICKQYPEKGEFCEHEESPYKKLFTSVAQVDDYYNKQQARRRVKRALR